MTCPIKHFIYILALFLISCGSKEGNSGISEKEQTDKVVSFEKLDSVQINYLGNPIVHDLDPVSRTVLFMDHKEYSEEIFLADFDGHIFASFTKFGDMPDSYGNLGSTLRLLEDNTFLAYGHKGFLTYNFEGELLSRVKTKTKNSNTNGFQRIAMGFGMEKMGDLNLYINEGSTKEYGYSDPLFYGESRFLNILDPETGEKGAIIQFPESSIFRSGKYFFRNAWNPVFDLADSKIYLAFRMEPVIYIFESKDPYSLVSKIPLDLPNYHYFKGTDNFSDNFLWNFISGKVENIKKIGEYLVVSYFPGYNEKDRETFFANKSPDETKEFRDRMSVKYVSRIAVFDSLGNRLDDFVPDGLMAHSMLARNGELWMMEAPDEEVERDYFRLFRMGLKVE